MRSRTRIALWLLLCIVCFSTGCSPPDRIVELSNGTYLSWDGSSWDVLDAGKNPGSLGGIVIVENVTALDVVDGKYVIGKEQSGSFFLIVITTENHDAVERFTSEEEWRASLRATGIATPRLRQPREVANSVAR